MTTERDRQEELDSFQNMLEEGLVKVCGMSGLPIDMMGSPDIDEKWDYLLKGYVADAIGNLNSYPDAALGFASYLGMAVANQWDKDWAHYKDKTYKSFYGDRGFDDMDEHITGKILHLNDAQCRKLSKCILNCAQATRDLLRHEGIETQTEYGFFILVRCYTAMFRIGAAIELNRLGYKKQKLPYGNLS